MKINHNNRDIDIAYDACSNCCFNRIYYYCAILPTPCYKDGHSYKISTKDSDIFNI